MILTISNFEDSTCKIVDQIKKVVVLAEKEFNLKPINVIVKTKKRTITLKVKNGNDCGQQLTKMVKDRYGIDWTVAIKWSR